MLKRDDWSKRDAFTLFTHLVGICNTPSMTNKKFAYLGKHVDKSSLLQNSKGCIKIVEYVPSLFERCKQVGGSLNIDRDAC